MIPNICHFIAGMSCNKDIVTGQLQAEQFTFINYVSVVSAILVNNPEKITFTYSTEPQGNWWDKLKQIERIEFYQVPLPTHFGKKEIIEPQHRADKLRIEILKEHGGVYLDTDTICVKPYKDILQYKYAMGIQDENRTLCNAVIFSEPNAEFLSLWQTPYEEFFNPTGWEECCVVLPMEVAKANPSKITMLKPECFFRPLFTELDEIFLNICTEISEEMYILHLWNACSGKHINKIHNIDWASKNNHTLLGKILLKLIDKGLTNYL